MSARRHPPAGRILRATIVALCLGLVAGQVSTTQVSAQPADRSKPARPIPPPPPAAPPPPAGPPPPVDPNAPPPYEPQLMRLAEVMGALHHLRTVCNAQDANRWRDRLAALIEADSPTQERRDRLAGAFNASFRTWARSYRVCTPAAEHASRMFLDETARIATEVRTRYGP